MFRPTPGRRAACSAALTVLTALALSPVAAAETQHTVEAGETLSHVAARYGVSQSALADANALDDTDRVVAGSTLVVPGDGTAGGVESAAADGVTVGVGETLSHIAARHGVSVAALAEANGLANTDHVEAGSTLTLPGAGGAAAGAEAAGDAGAEGVTVSAGDTLSHIAARHGLTVSGLAAANQLGDPDFVLAGASLSLSGSSHQAAAEPVDDAGTEAAEPAAAPPAGSVEALLARIAADYGWSADIVKAVAWQESGWNQQAVSHAGAVGIMQVMPGTGEFVAGNVLGRPLDLHNPADNVEAGVAFLDHVHGLTGGDLRMTLAGYYQGLHSVRQHGLFDDTTRYIDNVLALRDRY